MSQPLLSPVSKVVLLCDFFSTLGGTENYNAALARGLRDSGVEVRIYVGEKPPRKTWKTQLMAEGFFFKEPAIYHEDLSSNDIEKDFIDEIAQEINEWHPDVIHVHPFRKMAIQWLENGKTDKSIPLIATEWTVPNENASHWFEPNAQKYINKVHTFIATCEAIKLGLREYNKYEGPIVSIPHIIKEVPKQQLAHTNETHFSVGCISRFSPEKGLVFLIGAWKSVIEEFPNATLHLYGHGPEESELKALRDALGLSTSIFFEGTFNPGEVYNIAARHSVFVQPSLFESIPTSIIELMLAGRVVVASDVGGVSELVHHKVNGIVTKPGSTDEIAHGITTLLDSKELVGAYSAKAYDDAQAHYNYENTLTAILALYAATKSA